MCAKARTCKVNLLAQGDKARRHVVFKVWAADIEPKYLCPHLHNRLVWRLVDSGIVNRKQASGWVHLGIYGDAVVFIVERMVPDGGSKRR